MTLFNYLKVLTVTIMLVLLGNQNSWAAEANFSWLPNDSSDGTVGYMLYCGTSSRQYTESVDVGSPNPLNGRVYGSVSQLIPGQKYFFTVTAYDDQGDESSYAAEVVYTVPSDTTGSSGTTDSSLYDIYMSTSSSLSGAIPLDGTSVDWDIYVFTGPDTGVSKVIFSVDGVVYRTETKAPYELVGGAAYDTSKLSPGEHQISAMMYLTDGSTKFVSANFTIPSADDNSGSSSYDNTTSSTDDTSSPSYDNTDNENFHDIFVSASSNLSGATVLEGAEVEGDVYVFTGPDTGVSKVTFSIDGDVTRTESKAPFELVGGAAYDTSQLSPGEHEITAKFELSDGSTETVSAIFTVPSSSADSSSPSYADTRCEILVSETSYLSSAINLDGATVDGDIYVFTGPDTGVSKVTFSIDGDVTRTESKAPFELVGGAAYNASQLSRGTHQIEASVQFTDGTTESIVAVFTVK
jgi:hypothetical protein